MEKWGLKGHLRNRRFQENVLERLAVGPERKTQGYRGGESWRWTSVESCQKKKAESDLGAGGGGGGLGE